MLKLYYSLKPEYCSFQVMLFHMLFMPKYAERKASRMDKSLIFTFVILLKNSGY